MNGLKNNFTPILDALTGVSAVQLVSFADLQAITQIVVQIVIGIATVYTILNKKK